MDIMLFGCHGQVGRELQHTLPSIGTVIAYGKNEINFENVCALKNVIMQLKPDIIVNAAAYTHVEQAEIESRKVYAINTKAVQVLAHAAKTVDALLVHYSTDYIFDGTKVGAYDEQDTPHPINCYGMSKLAGEEAIRESMCRHIILRTSWVYSAHGRNFLKTMLSLLQERDSLRIVADQWGVPTSAHFIATITAQLLQIPSVQDCYHVVPNGCVNWYEYAHFIASHLDKAAYLTAISSKEYGDSVKRPKNSMLSNKKMSAALNSIPADWQQDVSTLIKQLLEKSGA